MTLFSQMGKILNDGVLIFIIPIIPLSTDNSLISPHPQGVYSAGPQGSSVFQNKVTLWEYNII
jgi:hypothetical protein